jgi:hypothetical protein
MWNNVSSSGNDVGFKSETLQLNFGVKFWNWGCTFPIRIRCTEIASKRFQYKRWAKKHGTQLYRAAIFEPIKIKGWNQRRIKGRLILFNSLIWFHDHASHRMVAMAPEIKCSKKQVFCVFDIQYNSKTNQDTCNFRPSWESWVNSLGGSSIWPWSIKQDTRSVQSNKTVPRKTLQNGVLSTCSCFLQK